MAIKKHIISIVGARPQFIKLAPLSTELGRRFKHTIIHTGQHYDKNMSDVFFKQLKIPKANLNLNVGGVGHGAMTGRMIEQLEMIYLKKKPDLVVVFGDTNSTLAGALAASKLTIPVAHVEAGLRSFVDSMPEEINRKLTDQISSLLFCPTEIAIKNLQKEGTTKGVIPSGDLMYEILHRSLPLIKKNAGLIKKLNLEKGKFALLTFHRAANTDSRDNLLKLIEILEKAGLPVLFPVHPRTRKMFVQFRLWGRLERIKHLVITDPLGYLDNLSAARLAKVVMTDSGGLQKEALFLGTPVLTLRDETEWVELLKKGNRLVGLDVAKTVRSIKSPPSAKKISHLVNGKKPSWIIGSEISRLLKGR